jgi:FixJ family two-component response regulator
MTDAPHRGITPGDARTIVDFGIATRRVGTEQKPAEATLREAQMALVNSNRVATMGQMAMIDAKPTVLVVDDDPDLRESVGRLLRSLGLDAQLFGSIADFRGSDPPDGPACLVLDVRLPGKSGLDLQRELAAANRQLPIIFITGHGDIPMTVQAMKGGAIEFLTKPFRDQDLLDAIQLGLSRDRVRRANEKALTTLRERLASLSPRERDVLIQVARGRLSKQIAGDIGIAEATVKVHRSRAMQKMKARSLPELGRMVDKLKLLPEEPQRS